MRITVLGSGASYPGAGRACASYLVESGDAAVLVDCGNGCVANLARVRDPVTLDAVLVTHGHVDHFADLYVLQAALRYAPDGPVAAVDLFAPEGAFKTALAPLSDSGRQEFREAFAAHLLAPGVPVEAGGLRIVPTVADHGVTTVALDVSDGVHRVFFTSDTRCSVSLAAAARGADVLIADATLPERYAGKAPHMTPREAAEMAAAAGVKMLVLSHLWPTVDRAEAALEASSSYAGRIMVAEEMLVIDLAKEP